MLKSLASLVLIATLTLAGCASNFAPTLAQTQAESQAITTALTAGVTLYAASPSVSGVIVAMLQADLTNVQAANSVIQGTTSVTAAPTAATAFAQAVQILLQALPLDPATKVAIDAGLAVIDTFVQEQNAAPAKLTLPAHVTPPVRIPLPHAVH